MGKKSVIVIASGLLAGAALSGCSSSESWRSQGPSRFPNAGVTPMSAANNPNSAAAGRAWGTNPATNNQAGMLPSANGVQPAGGVQPSVNTTGSTGVPGAFNSAAPGNPSWANSKTSIDSSVNSRQTDLTAPSLPSVGISGQGPSAGRSPVPPTPPSSSDQASGNYSIPVPKSYSPPANSDVKTRVPGDDN
jgi:hypothetical protein